MNILLTGSGGFIGRHLKECFKDKYTLLTPRSSELNLLNSLEVDEYFKENKIDIIVHSAAIGVRITSDATKEDVAIPNIQMFDNLTRHVSEKCRMIVFGSGAEYDKSRSIIDIKEDDFGVSIPQDPYGYSKYIISKKIENINNIINLRIFGIYGYGEDASRVTSYIINSNLNHQPINLNQNVIFDFIYIDDFCKIVDFFINNPCHEKFINVTSGTKVEIKKLAEIINGFSNYKSEINFIKPGYNKEYSGNNSRLRNLLGDFKFTSYEEGMKSFYNQLEKDFVYELTD